MKTEAKNISELVDIMAKSLEERYYQSKMDLTGSKSPDETTLRYALRAMGNYFDLPEKEVKFFIRQMELAGKFPNNEAPFKENDIIEGKSWEEFKLKLKMQLIK